MREALPSLRDNRPEDATAFQELAFVGIEDAQVLLTEHFKNIAAYAGMVAITDSARKPSPYLDEIIDEQRDMYAITKEMQPSEIPTLTIPQRNLIHAVEAILTALDPVSHLVETGTIMLFAMEDMHAASEALAIQDDIEALDAQDYIVETLVALRAKIDAVVPKFNYLMEISEALHEHFQEGALIRQELRTMRQKLTQANVDAMAWNSKQQEMSARTDSYAKHMEQICGFDIYADAIANMHGVEDALPRSAIEEASAQMKQAELSMQTDTDTILTLMKNITLVLAAPPPEMDVPQEILFLQEVLAVAAEQKHLYRRSHVAKPQEYDQITMKLVSLEKSLDPFIERATQHTNPVLGDEIPPAESANLHIKLVATKAAILKAIEYMQASEIAKAIDSQKIAVESLRHFVCEYAFKFALVPPPPAPSDPAPTTDFSESEDLLSLYMPGVVSGKRPPDGRLEWEVLGKRDRAALNENFARELPLEYREILKDYYERLAK
jgi:hypothetical protein